jgi:lipid II:glycine glycyltransferase (peptidoglycan interpeptide bridge formation enzyme)
MNQFVRTWGKLKEVISFPVDHATREEIEKAKALGVEVNEWLRSLYERHRDEFREIVEQARQREIGA